jgi:hypothetical protein
LAKFGTEKKNSAEYFWVRKTRDAAATAQERGVFGIKPSYVCLGLKEREIGRWICVCVAFVVAELITRQAFCVRTTTASKQANKQERICSRRRSS